MSNLNGKIAVVTGVSHAKGIGAAICRQLAKAGTDIFFTYFKADESWEKDFTSELTQVGVRCEGLEVDLSESSSSEKILDAAENKLGVPTILVNNAAHSMNNDYLNLDAESLDSHYTVNVRATCLLSVQFARKVKQKNLHGGRIINMTSGQALGPMVGELAYAATKGAISAFTLSLSAEVASAGITVNAVNPGPTDTGWMTEEIKQHLSPKFLMGRAGVPADAARLVAFLTSNEAQWVTGQVINSEGGFLRS